MQLFKRHHKKLVREDPRCYTTMPLESKYPSDEGVSAPPDLTVVDFDQLPTFANVIGMTEANAVVRKYPFR